MVQSFETTITLSIRKSLSFTNKHTKLFHEIVTPFLAAKKTFSTSGDDNVFS
jgi:hypothetical protein